MISADEAYGYEFKYVYILYWVVGLISLLSAQILGEERT